MKKRNTAAALLTLALTLMACQQQSPAVQTTQIAPAVREEPTESCDLLAGVMRDIPGSNLTRSVGRFEDDIGGSFKEGCLLTIEGSFKALETGQTADGRIALFAESKGWQPDNSHSADGPDGTVFAFWTPTAWCLVRGKLDSGDESDPTNIPDDRYEITIGCAPR